MFALAGVKPDPLMPVRVAVKVRMGRVHRVEAAALPESLDREQYLVSSPLVSGGVDERNRTFSMLDHSDIGVGSDLKSSDVVGEMHSRGRLRGSECNRIVDREAEVNVLRESCHQIKYGPINVEGVDI